jgi:hypothetical protein
MTNTKDKMTEEANKLFAKPAPASQPQATEQQKILDNMARLRRERLEREGRQE